MDDPSESHGDEGLDPLGATVAVGEPIDPSLSTSPAGAPPTDPIEHARLRASVRGHLFGPDPTPVRIGRFRIASKLGEGGMGVVFAAFDEDLQRTVAIKLLPEAGDGARLQAEARAMARLAHPNIAAIYDVGTHRDGDGTDRTYVAMEYVEGESLGSFIRQGRPWREVLSVFEQAGRGLAAAHAAGIVHRDFKPDNAILGSDGRVRVLDFGLATTTPAAAPLVSEGAERGALSLTRTGALVGTPRYMAPEQFAGEPTTEATDQFAFCVALVEALWRHRPFPASGLPELAARVAAGRLEPPPARPGIPHAMWPVLRRGLSTRPEERHRSMDDLLAALASVGEPAGSDESRARRWPFIAGALVLAAAAVAWATNPQPERAELWGRLPNTSVGGTVRAHQPEVQRCWAAALQRRPGLRGKVESQFVIGPSGAVDAIESISATLRDARQRPTDDAELRACLDRNIRSWVFPRPEGGPVRVTYPFRSPG